MNKLGFTRVLQNELKPKDPAYFTGNSNYYFYLSSLNKLIGKFGREDQLSAINESRVAKNFKKIDSEAGKLEEFKHDKQKWLSMNNMTNKLSLRLNDSTYQDLIDRLNVLYPIQNEEVNAVLEPFADQKKYFASIKPPVLELDEFGRSFTSASRKTSKAQVWIVPGQGQIYVNGQSMATYFSLINWRASIVKPFEVAHKLGQFNVWAISHGGGLTGQAEAIQVAIARGIVVHDPDAEPLLESAGLLRIDRRQVERKKTGQPKARKKITWVKR